VQVGRTSNTFEAVSGRIGALAIRNDGKIILGAAQGGIWAYDNATRTWTSRTPDATTRSIVVDISCGRGRRFECRNSER
jgi:hypothetical protein